VSVAPEGAASTPGRTTGAPAAMRAPEVVVVTTGTANLASVEAALRRAGASPRCTADPAEVEAAARVVLPGVGTFAEAMRNLVRNGLVEPLVTRVRSGRATLAICLGLQILCEASDESPGVAGLGVVPGSARRFPDHVRVPQLGWNRIEAPSGSPTLRSGYAYFANSYRLQDAPEGWRSARVDHGGPCVAALERGAVLVCQFDPELSGGRGVDLLRRWLSLQVLVERAPMGGRPC